MLTNCLAPVVALNPFCGLGSIHFKDQDHPATWYVALARGQQGIPGVVTA